MFITCSKEILRALDHKSTCMLYTTSDGLRLSFEGTEVTFENFESAIMEVNHGSVSIFTRSAMDYAKMAVKMKIFR